MIHCKRFALFAAPRHEGGLGWHDFRGLFDTLDEAQTAFVRDPSDMEAHVADLLTERIVSENPRESVGWRVLP